MKNIFKKENLMPVIVLGSICLVVAALMGAVNMITGPIIQKAEEQKVYDSLREVLDGEFEPAELPSDAPSTVTALYKVTEGGDLVGHVVTVEKQGYASKILLTVGIDKDGKTTKVVITSQQETHGKDISPLLDGLASVGADEVMDVEHVSNATKTSNYIKEAVADAFKVVGFETTDDGGNEEEEEETLPKTDEEIMSLASALVGEGAELVDVTPDETELVKRVYKDKGGKGYVAYIVVISENYGTVESETLVHVGTDGKIAGINKLVWKTSDAIYGYVPPEEETVNAFYDRLVGNDSESLENVELVTNATNTSTNVVSSLTEALTIIDSLILKDMPRDEAEVISLAGQMIGEGAELIDVTPEETELVKRVYKDNGGNGYVAYVVVISANYGTVESETLIHVGNNGKIQKINKLTWKTSDAIYGYVPPEEETVNAFYDRLVGNNSESVGNVELVTNATNTSTNVVSSITEALTVIDELLKGDMPRDEAEIISLAGQMIGGGAELVNVTPDNTSLVKRIYKDNGGNGYVAYVVVISANYGTVESETLIHVGSDGKIKDINKLVWKTSDAIYGYVPPTDEEVNAFYDRLVGNDSASIGDVELVTNATNTSTNVVTSFTEALTAIDELRGAELPRTEAEIITLAGQLVGVTPDFTDVTPGGTEYVKRIYVDNGGNGYVAYIVVISANYGTVESETLVHIDNDGKIVSVNKLVWKTSDAIYGYVPPEEETVNAFYDRLVGNDFASLGDVELVTNATNTSTNVVNSVSEALNAVKDLPKIDKPRSDEDIKDLAAELVGADTELLEVTVSDTSYVKRVYNAGDKGHVVYVVVISENYGTVESETLIHVGTDGKIKDINKLVWKTSDAIYGYVPPEEDEVNAFYERLKGNDFASISDVELVANATNTSTNVVASFKEALKVVDDLTVPVVQPNNSARIVGIVILCVSVIAFAAYVALPIIKRRKRA